MARVAVGGAVGQARGAGGGMKVGAAHQNEMRWTAKKQGTKLPAGTRGAGLGSHHADVAGAQRTALRSNVEQSKT